MTGKITALAPNGEYTNKFGKLTTKTLVSFADGKQYTFGSLGDFKHKVGDEIQYEVTSEQYGNAKLIIEFNQKPNMMQGKSNDTHLSILRQVAFKGAIEMCIHDKITPEQVERTTEYFFTNILNK